MIEPGDLRMLRCDQTLWTYPSPKGGHLACVPCLGIFLGVVPDNLYFYRPMWFIDGAVWVSYMYPTIHLALCGAEALSEDVHGA